MRFSLSEIAVLIPTFQPKQYFSRCIDSLRLQTLSRVSFRLYVVLNGKRYPYEQFILDVLLSSGLDFVYTYQSVPSVSKARNLLLDQSDEPFVVFIDDDDWVSPDFLGSLYERRIEAGFVASHVGTVNARNGFSPNYVGRFSAQCAGKIFTDPFFCRKFFSSACAKLLSREVIGDVRFNEELAIGEDSVFMAMLAINVLSVRVAGLNCKYFVDDRADSVSRSPEPRLIRLRRHIHLLFIFATLLADSRSDKRFMLSRMYAVLRSIF